jgi:hypothetical protein
MKNIINSSFKISKKLFFVLFIILIFKDKKGPIQINKELKSNINDLFPYIKFNNKNKKTNNPNDIFNSRELIINDLLLTNQYIRYIRPIYEKTKKKKKNQNYINQKYINIFKKRENESKNYIENCLKEKLIDKKIYNSIEKPLISVVLPSFNKEKVLMKSIRSIQNQSFKNVEIIIVDDCSRDNSKHYYNYLLKTDPRIRIFTHLKNMGVWRTRIDGVLYSRGKYIIHFDTGDLYSDEYVLEDAYNLVERYNLDSIRMLFKVIDSYDHANNKKIPNFPINGEYNKIVYEKDNIKEYNQQIFTDWGTLWTRLAKAEIFIKGLYLLSSSILNIHKNLWEDIWWNKIIDQVSYNLLIVNRYSYLYLYDAKGVGTIIKLNFIPSIS